MTEILSTIELEKLIETLKTRFEKNINRHKEVKWSKVEERLRINTEKIWSLYQMEKTGGEPDVIGYYKL